MKHSKRFCRWLLCTLLCLCLAGCSMPGEQVQVEELLRAPKLSGDYGDVQTALNDWLGESAQLKYPMQGDLLSPFLIHDLDGDGQQDAAVLYTTAQSSNVCVAILQKGRDGMWQVRQNAEGLADTVDSVGLAQLQQLRGRGGRGRWQSYCFLITQSQSELAQNRGNPAQKRPQRQKWLHQSNQAESPAHAR